MIHQKIKEALASWDEPFVELAIFGTADPERIAATIEEFCERSLYSRIKECLLWSASIGIAAGLVLESGARILIKCHQPSVSKEKLLAVERVRRLLQQKSFPGPGVLLGVAPLAHGWATVEEFVDAPAAVDGFLPEHRTLLARGLAEMVNLLEAQQEDLGGYLLSQEKTNALWPVPHSKLFDFEATREGADWIDSLAKKALEILNETQDDLVIAHLDWRVEHVRIRDNKIITVFDWDSLCYDRESAALGSASVHWPADWSSFAPTIRKVPNVEESNQFVEEYLAARERAPSKEFLRAVGAYRLYCLGYTARCGHALNKNIQPGSAGEALQQYGEKFL